MAEETSAKQIPGRETEMAGNKIKIAILCQATDEAGEGTKRKWQEKQCVRERKRRESRIERKKEKRNLGKSTLDSAISLFDHRLLKCSMLIRLT